MADQYYIEQDYFDGKYFGIIADAVISLNPYIEEGYYDGDYYVPTGGQATLTCSAEVLTGVTHEAEGAIASEFTITAAIGKLQSATIDLSGVFTPTLTAEAIKNTDAVLESIASLTSTADVTRNFDSALSSEATVSADVDVIIAATNASALLESSASLTCDAVRTLSTASSQSSEATLSANNIRFRNFEQTSTSNFSVTAGPDVIRGFDATVSAEFSTSVATGKIQSATIDLSGVFTPVLTVEAIRNSDAVLDAVASMTADISVNKTASVALASIINQNLQAAVTRNLDSSINSSADLSVSATHIKSLASDISSEFTIKPEPQIPTRLVGDATFGGTSSVTISSTRSKFGGNSLLADSKAVNVEQGYFSYVDDARWSTWRTIDFWIYVEYSAVSSNYSWGIVGQFGDQTYLQSTTNPFWSVGAEYRASGQYAIRLTKRESGGSTSFVSVRTTTELSYDNWHHVRIVNSAANGGTLKVYLDGTAVSLSAAFSIGTWGGGTSFDVAQPLYFLRDFARAGESTLSHTTYTNSAMARYIDEFLITDDLLTDPITTSTFTVPSAPYSNTLNTDLLLHFDSNFEDDAEEVNSANLTTESTLTATATISKDLSATVSSTTSVAATATVILNAQIDLASEFTLSADAIEIPIEFSSDISSEFAVSADFGLIKTGDSTLASQATLSAEILRIQQGSITTESIFTELVAIAITGQGFITLESTLTLDANIEITKTFISDQSASTALVADPIKVVDGSTALTSEFSIVIDNERTRDLISLQVSAGTLTVQINAITDTAVDMSVSSTMVTDNAGLIGISSDLESVASLAIDFIRIRPFESSQSSQTELTASGILSVDASATLASEFTQTSQESRTRSVSITTESIFTELAAVALTGQGFVTLEAVSTIVIDAVKTTGIVIVSESQSTVSADISVTARTSSTMSSSSELSATGEAGLIGQAQLESSFTLTADPVAELSGIVLTASLGSMTADVRAIRGLECSMSAFDTQLTLGEKITGFSCSMQVNSTIQANPGILYDSEIALSMFGSATCSFRIIHIDPELTWTIPEETKVYVVVGEDRIWDISQETRLYII